MNYLFQFGITYAHILLDVDDTPVEPQTWLLTFADLTYAYVRIDGVIECAW